MLKAYKGFKFSFFILFSLFIIPSTLLPNAQVQTQSIPQLPAEQLKTEQYNQAYLDELLQKYDQTYIDELLQKYGPDFVHKILHAQEIKEEELLQKNNILLKEISLWNGRSIGIYRGDLVRGGFFVTETGLDFLLFQNLQKFYSQEIFEYLLINSDIIIQLILKNPAENQFYKISLKNNIVKNILSYFIPSEIFRITKNELLGKQDVTSFKKFISGSWNGNFSKTQPQQLPKGTPIPISYITESIFICSQPLDSTLSYGNHLINEAFRLLNLRPKFLDSYSVKLLKKLSVLILYLKWFNKFCQNNWLDYINNHKQEFILILTQYNQAKTNPADEEEIKKCEQQLKKFIDRSQDQSFYDWLKSKNLTIAKNKFLTNAIVNLPTYFLLIKAIYKQIKLYKETTT